MAAQGFNPQPPQQQQQPGAPQGGAPASAPSAQPANQTQQILAQMYQLAQQLAASNPLLSSGMQKVADGVQEAQTALVTQPQQPSFTQTPPY